MFITSQKFKTVPTAIRSTVTIVFVFQLSPGELKMISDELIYSNVDLESAVAQMFGEGRKFFVYNVNTGRLFAEFDEVDGKPK